MGLVESFAKTTDGTRRGAFRANPDVESKFLTNGQSLKKSIPHMSTNAGLGKGAAREILSVLRLLIAGYSLLRADHSLYLT